MAALGPELVVMNGKGEYETIFRLPAEDQAGMHLKPRPLVSRRREPIVPDRVALANRPDA